MNSQLKNILRAERIDELFSIAKEKPVLAGEFFIKAGKVPFKVAFVLDGLFKFSRPKNRNYCQPCLRAGIYSVDERGNSLNEKNNIDSPEIG
jgi:hypothetical protein